MFGTGDWQDGTVLLPVPLKYVHEVAEFAAALASGRTPSALTDRGQGWSESVAVPGQGAWTQAMVESVADAVPYAAVLALLDRCADQEGQWVPKSEVEEAGGFSPIQLRNELGAFSKKTNKLFGQAVWPMEWKKERGSYFYRLDPVVAGWWKAAREENQR